MSATRAPVLLCAMGAGRRWAPYDDSEEEYGLLAFPEAVGCSEPYFGLFDPTASKAHGQLCGRNVLG